jgi:DNA-binding IclR family transcriptional regulator
VDLRGVLRELDKTIGSSPYKIVSFTRSYGYELQSDYWLETLSPCNGNSLQRFRQCSASYKHYERSAGVSSSALPQWNPRFGKNQAGISAALIAQQLSKLAGAKRK